jgi:hypothetical protein
MNLRFLAIALIAVGFAFPTCADCVFPHWTVMSELSRSAQGIRAVDLNGDNKPDIVGFNATTVFVALNDGTGHFSGATDVYAGTIVGPVVTGDFTGDAVTDLAFGSTNSLVVLPGNGNGTFGTPRTSAVTVTVSNLATATLDAGNSLDLIVYDSALAVLLQFVNDGTGSFTERVRGAIQPNASSLVVTDFDGDTHADAVVGYGGSQYDGFFGTADGTFGKQSTIRGSTDTTVLRAADMDGSGLPDLLSGSLYWGYVATLRNLGARTFSDPIFAPYVDGVMDFQAADLNSDGFLDAASISPWCAIDTAIGTGLGTFRSVAETTLNNTWYSCYLSIGQVEVADFDADGRKDLLVAMKSNSASFVRVYRNRCGDSNITVTAAASRISVGTSAAMTVSIASPDPWSEYLAATGSVSIKETTTTLATGTLSESKANFSIAGLPVGTHALVAAYPGDEQYEASESAPVNVTVTTDTTTTTITASPDPAQYGLPPAVSATVTASNGQAITGTIAMTIDGQNVWPTQTGATATVPSYNIPGTVGTHTVTANYPGDAVQPPSSATRTYVVAKRTPTLTLSDASAVEGQTKTVTLYAGSGGSSPTGAVTLSLESTSLGTRTMPQYNPYASFTIPALAAGRYTLLANYAGDANHNAVETRFPLNVFPSTGESIDARGNAAAVVVSWKTDKLIIRRKAVNQAWATGGGSCCPSQPWIDTYPQPETVYLYRMEGHDGTWTDADIGMRISFSDDPMLTGTSVKALHLQEIVRAANILRSAANLSSISDAPFAAGSPVAAASLQTLRSAINEARVALGAVPYAFTAVINSGLPLRAVDIQEFREAVR